MVNPPPYSPPPQRFAGGHLPPVGPVFSETLTAFTRDLGPYALAGLGQLLVLLPVIFGVFIVAYAVIFVVAIGGVAGSAVIADRGSDSGAAVFTAAMVAVMVLVSLGIAWVVNAILAPIFGSLYRAVACHQRGEQPLGFGSVFSSMGTHLVSGIVAMVLVTTLVLLGALFCYLPGLVVALFLTWTFPLAALHGVGAFAALKRSVSHVRQHFKWHLGFFLYWLLISFVANNIPLIGPMFVVAFTVRVYREVFGDGDQPVVGQPPRPSA